MNEPIETSTAAGTERFAPTTTISESYLSLIDVWLRSGRQNMPSDPQVICMDSGAYDALTGRDGVSALQPSSELMNAPNRRAFWVRRLAALRAVFDEQGYVLHSDADAFWLRPATELVGGADLIFSSEHGLPKDIVKRRGFVLCCGFFAAHETPATTDFFDIWQDRCLKESDDQIALNRMIDETAAPWEPFDHKGETSYRTVADFGAGPVTIVALSTQLVCREHAFDAPTQAYVAHPFFERRFHHAFVALYDRLLQGGSIQRVERSAAPVGWKDRDWATLAAYRALGEDIPAACTSHAGHLALRNGEIAWASALLESTPPQGDDYFDLYQVRSARGDRKGARAVLNELVRRRLYSERQTLAVLRAALRERSLGSASQIGGSLLARMLRPQNAYAVARRLTLKARGAI